MTTTEYEAAIQKWREERVERLRTNDRSWFGLAGLFWLKEGANTFGSAPTCNFVLPASAPKKAGTFIFENGQVTVEPEPKVKITCNGGEIPDRGLLDDQADSPDYLYMGHLIMVVLKRGTSTLIRLWDIDHPMKKALTNLNFYPIQPEYRVTAKYTGYAPYKIVQQADIIGELTDRKMIGYVEFKLNGEQIRMDAEDGGEGLFFAFRDKTNANTTYAGGRYLVSEKVENGQVVIDFNKTYNMPCSYTVYATCSLATPQNRLNIMIEAGERKYQESH